MTHLRPLGLARQRRYRTFRWVMWASVIVFTPTLSMAAYQPAWLDPAKNLTDIANAATAWVNLGGGTAGKKAASDNTKATVASVSGATVLGHMATFSDTSGTVGDGGVAPTGTVTSVTCGAGLTGGTITGTGTCAIDTTPVAPTIYTGSLPLTLPATNNLFEVVEMATPAAGTINLPASPAAGLTVCVKDGLKNFAANVATIKTTDSATIDKVAGATGYPMNQSGQQTCFRYAAANTNWYIY